jgi:hypothetical protein
MEETNDAGLEAAIISQGTIHRREHGRDARLGHAEPGATTATPADSHRNPQPVESYGIDLSRVRIYGEA